MFIKEGLSMEKEERESILSRFSAPGAIAWLSLFLLTFALGGRVDAQWHQISLQIGAIGLISAVGLGSLEKARRIRAKFLRDRALRERLDRRIGLEEWDVVNGSQIRCPLPVSGTQLSGSEVPHQTMPI
jgi:hypothetical protein